MEITIKYKDEVLKLAFRENIVKVRDIFKNLKLTPETAFLVKNGQIAEEFEVISESDEIEVISVISGG